MKNSMILLYNNLCVFEMDIFLFELILLFKHISRDYRL